MHNLNRLSALTSVGISDMLLDSVWQTEYNRIPDGAFAVQEKGT
jgi:hypothetical protein